MAIISKSWQSWFKTSPLRIHTMSFRAQRGTSPFAQRKGARGMHTRHSRAGGNPEGTGWENHGNHFKIMAIMVQQPKTLQPVISPFAFTPCHSERSEEFPPSHNVRGLGGCPAPKRAKKQPPISRIMVQNHQLSL